MSGGLAALLDDIATLAKAASASIDDVGTVAARTSIKAAAVVVDDTAVTPRYLQGFSPSRELPVVAKIARGSLLNKAIIIVAAMMLSQWAPWLLTPLLMCGGFYLAFEGAEKVLDWLGQSTRKESVQPTQDENQVVSSAVRTDFILSAEIMVISLKEVTTETFWMRLAVLVVVAVAITFLVYGVVGIIVKLDDMGLALAKRKLTFVRLVGRALVRSMPIILKALTIIGTLAMLWVGGHILISGMGEVGWSLPAHALHHLTANLGDVLAWLVDTGISTAVGMGVGVTVIGVLEIIKKLGGRTDTEKKPTK
ncbi:MAG: DUF808 domain-containing protein [Actinomycetaceae bacterium]|nr:DUF808 domain-containing protein [Actinomycetaceae bacterium]